VAPACSTHLPQSETLRSRPTVRVSAEPCRDPRPVRTPLPARHPLSPDHRCTQRERATALLHVPGRPARVFRGRPTSRTHPAPLLRKGLWETKRCSRSSLGTGVGQPRPGLRLMISAPVRRSPTFGTGIGSATVRVAADVRRSPKRLERNRRRARHVGVPRRSLLVDPFDCTRQSVGAELRPMERRTSPSLGRARIQGQRVWFLRMGCKITSAGSRLRSLLDRVRSLVRVPVPIATFTPLAN
jgi:hypothetical protein